VIGAVIVTTFLNSVAFIGVGVYRSYHAYRMLITEGVEGKPGIELINSLDIFLIALVFLIMSLGFSKLFYKDFPLFKSIDLPWLKIDDFFDLKILLWNTVLLSLVVAFAVVAIENEGHWEWTMLVVPAAVLLFSLGAKFIKH
jgi:uncharacterized membrane protein YqhA